MNSLSAENLSTTTLCYRMPGRKSKSEREHHTYLNYHQVIPLLKHTFYKLAFQKNNVKPHSRHREVHGSKMGSLDFINLMI